MNIAEICKCDGTAICPFCKIIVVSGIAFISALVGYFVGRKKK